MALRKGGEQAQEEAAKRQGGSFARTNYFNLPEDGDTAVLRYITDSPDWAYTDQHASVPTKNKPADYDGRWPESMPAVCRYDPLFTDEKTGKREHDDCYICDAEVKNKWNRVIKPQVRNWAIACLREEVQWTEEDAQEGRCEPKDVGRRRGYTDAIREITKTDDKGEPTGEVVQERALVVVNQAPSNYFNGLQSMYGIYGTVCDRDYVVKRNGDGTDTKYDHIPLDKTPNLMPGEERWAKYEEAIKEQGLDLEQIIRDRASDEYYARFFDPNKTPAKKDGKGKSSSNGKSDTPPEPPAAASSEVDPDRLEAMRNRVRNHGGGQQKAAASADVD